jgi:hypothetical protein
MEEMKTVNAILIGKPQRVRSRGKPRCRLEDNIKTDLKRERGCKEGTDWIIIL